LRSAFRDSLSTTRFVVKFVSKVLRTPTLVDNHFRQVSFNDITIRSEVYKGHGGEFNGRTAGLHATQAVQLAVFFDDMRIIVEKGVWCSVYPPAISLAVVRVVAAWRYDPVFPAQLLEADEETLLAALASERPGAVQRPASHSPGRRRVGVHDEEGSLRVLTL